MYHTPIPAEPADELSHQPPIMECEEPLIPLSTFSERIFIYPSYYLQDYDGTTEEAYLRSGVANRLQQAAEMLPEGFFFVVFDGWRSYEVQQSLYNRFKESLLAQGWQEGEELDRELTKFVARPTRDLSRPSPHLTGAAIDLTISGPDGWLEMGTEFDDFSEVAATRYFEELSAYDERTLRIRDNRRLLYHVMNKAGFTNYPREWWHFEYGTISWARKNRTSAIYGGIATL
ncbi:M15 family metallopeptidase [Brevibacillus migulae]|uniref:M15 family metallopeptidase n=1 Tax=Brevibacillus migulae TaxID=1644114 RepID=UPI00106E4D69|nr:M15 family metallopeptidase [Brevibacillus migulae]